MDEIMTKTEKMMFKTAKRLLAVAPTVAAQRGSTFVWGKPKIPSSLQNK